MNINPKFWQTEIARQKRRAALAWCALGFGAVFVCGVICLLYPE